MFSLEDSVCAGMLVQMLADDATVDLVPSDAATAATILYKGHKRNLPKMLKNCEHGKYLTTLGFERDLAVCSAIDTVPVLPHLVGNVIKLQRDAEKVEATKAPVMT
jgi:2-phosphosulfolactate phosphatase